MTRLLDDSKTPLICFGQQPNGFFPRRYLVAKIETARRLQAEIGGEIVLFYHDSDHDYRETITILHDSEGREERLNFTQENKVQKKYSPLYLKRIPSGWQEDTFRRLPRFMPKETAEIFGSVQATNVADFCLEMYQKLGLLDGIRVVRSSDQKVREQAIDITDGFADVSYEREIVRARYLDGKLFLHQGGENYIDLPEQTVEKWQKSPHRNTRMNWMRSVVPCTHYIYGKGEGAYLDFTQYPDVEFIVRDDIEDQDGAWTG